VKTIKEQSPGNEDATTARVAAYCPQSAEGDLKEVPGQADTHQAPGASLGKTTPGRTLSLKAMTDVEEIWKAAEERLGTNRGHFALVQAG
jgi:hypothetical protein